MRVWLIGLAALGGVVWFLFFRKKQEALGFVRVAPTFTDHAAPNAPNIITPEFLLQIDAALTDGKIAAEHARTGREDVYFAGPSKLGDGPTVGAWTNLPDGTYAQWNGSAWQQVSNVRAPSEINFSGRRTPSV